MAAHLAPGECMTEAERLAILRRLAEALERGEDCPITVLPVKQPTNTNGRTP